MLRAMRSKLLIAGSFVLLVICSAGVAEVTPPTAVGGLPPEAVAKVVADMIADAIPREYEKYKDWGNTKRITTGLDFKGHPWDPKIDRRKSDVNDGVWKHYRVTLVEPEKNLAVRVDNLRSLDAGQVGFTLNITAKLHGWAQARVFGDGVSLGTYTGEGDSVVNLTIDGEIALETTPSSFLTGVAIHPHVTAARVKLDDFRLTRIGEIRGALAHDLGDGLKRLIEDELEGPKLVDKLNHSIDKHREKLKITPERLLGMTSKR
jgi:hypothetical protein